MTLRPVLGCERSIWMTGVNDRLVPGAEVQVKKGLVRVPLHRVLESAAGIPSSPMEE